MIIFYDIPRSELDSKPFEEEALYCCNDTGEIFLDSKASGARIQISSGIIMCASSLPLAPIPNKLYIVVKTGTIHAYINDAWVNLSDRPQIHFKNVVVGKNSTLTIEDSRILETDSAVFVPDLSIADLAADITVSCSNGSISVVSNSNYDLPGTVIVN